MQIRGKSITKIKADGVIPALMAELDFMQGNTIARTQKRNLKDVYVVYSYGVPYAIKCIGDATWYLNGELYSHTTARLQNAVRQAAQGHLVECSTEEEFQDTVYSKLGVTI